VKPADDYRSNACTQLVEQDVLARIRERTAEAELVRATRAAKQSADDLATGRSAVPPAPGGPVGSILRVLRREPR
jgi:hypothetical protein